MRVIIIIALLIQVSLANGQADKKQAITVEDALILAFRNNPDTLTISDRKKLSSDIKSAWYLWLFKIHKWQTLQDYEYMLADMGRIATERYQAGDIDLLEKSTFMAQLAEIKTNTLVLAVEIVITGNLLKQFLLAEIDFVPADSTLALYQVDKGSSDGMLTDITVENMQLGLDGCFIKLQFYNYFGLAHAETILQTSRAKFETEEIDYLEFTDNIAEAFKIRLEYLETLNNYNQKAIHLEYYAY